MDAKKDDEIRKLIQDNMGDLRRYMERDRKQEESPYEEVFRVLHEAGVDLSMEKILADYEEMGEDTQALCDRYYEQYGELLKKPQKEDWVNEDLTDRLIRRIVSENHTAGDTGDLYLINKMIGDMESETITMDQPVIEDFYKALILHAKKKDIHRLDQVGDYYDMNYCAKTFIKFCHNRGLAFRNLIKEFFRTFEDADMKMLPSAYREVMAEKKKQK